MKLSDIKESIGYLKEGPRCGNCRFFESKTKIFKHYNHEFLIESELRCTRKEPAFKTGKTAWCSLHEWKEGQP